MRAAITGSVLLLALIISPDPGQAQCPTSPVKADTQAVVGPGADGTPRNKVIGRITHDGDWWENIYYSWIHNCGIYPGNWSVDPVYTIYPSYSGGGIFKIYDECTEVCNESSRGGLAKIQSGYVQYVNPGSMYRFRWKLGAEVYDDKRILVPAEFWDAPTPCPTCIGDSETACVHPKPRSLEITPPPDLILKSPLGDRAIGRIYRTALVGDTTAGDGMFGKGWWANFEYRIGTLNGDSTYGVMLFDAAGRKTFYLRPNYPYLPVQYNSPDGRGGNIYKAEDGSYRWLDAQGASHQFDSVGKILSITDIHGNEETFGYSSGRLTSLTDRHGRTVTFDYQGTSHVKRLLGPPIAANPTGVYATYDYDENGNLTGVSFPDGNALSYEYENSPFINHMTRFSFIGTSGSALQQRIQYNAQGRVQAVSEGPEGRSYQLAYGSDSVDFDPSRPELGQITRYRTTVTEWTDANWDLLIDGGEVAKPPHTYYYENHNGADVITKIEDGDCSCAAEKTYDPDFHVVQKKDNKGIVSLMTYSSYGDLTSLTEAAGTADEKVMEYEYTYATAPVLPAQILQKITRVHSVVSPNDDKLTTEINDPATGKLLIRREQGYRVDGSALTSETVYSYTASGSVHTVDGPRPGTQDLVTYDYYSAGDSAAGLLWKITEPNGAVTTFQQYDELGNVLRKTDANNRETSSSYDIRGLLQAQTTVEGTTHHEYDAQGRITRTIYPRGNSVAYTYGQSALKRVFSADGRTDYGYANGNKVSKSVYDANAVMQMSEAYDYDVNNRLWRTRQANGDFEEYLYDENGNQTHKKLYAAAAPSVPFKTTVQEYDFLNRLKAVSVQDDPYHVTYGYDAQGNLNTVIDPISQITSFVYDDLGRQSRVVSPETGTTEFAYDEAGNVMSRRDNLNRLISYTHDGLNRTTDITYPDATPPVHYRYDNYSAGTYPDAVGRLTEVTDASGFRRFFYNAAGRLSKVVHVIDEHVLTTEYTYDDNGNLATLTYPSGRIIQYSYDPASDRVQSVTSWKNGVPTVLAEGITYKPFGPLNGLDYGNGTHLARGYENLMYRLDSLAVTGSLGDLLPVRSYDYDPAGNIHEITRGLPGGPEPHLFEYDLMDRLSIWNKPGRTQELVHDANGNRESLSDNGVFTSYSYDPIARNILAGSTGTENLVYDHDPLGNTTVWGTKSLVYDTDSRLQRVDDGGVPLGEYVYNIDGQRTKKTVSDQNTYFEYDTSSRLLHEYRMVGGIDVDYVYLGGEPLAMLVSDDLVVTPYSGANGSLTPSNPQSVVNGQSTAFTVTPDVGYHIVAVTGCGGTLNGSIYTTGPITADCTVTANFTINSYTVTPSAGTSGSLTPSTPQVVDHGQSTAFTVAPDVGYHIVAVTGCGGTLNGSIYTAGPITADCTVMASFDINGYTVTPDAGTNGSLTPSTPQVIDHGQSTTFTVTPDVGYHIVAVTGCDGTLNGSMYTTGPITADCTVTANFTINSYTVTPSAGTSGSLTPSTPQVVDHGQSTAFAVAPDVGYHIDAVTGCGGTLNGSIYTTGPITADCTVMASFDINSYTVTPDAGTNGSLTPSTPQVVDHGQSTAFTVALDVGYHIDAVTGCGGTLNGSIYTTGPITADCTVTANFTINSYSLTTTKYGSGVGTLTSTPAGINCGPTCSTTYNHGTIVNLSQTADAGSVFVGWGGACSASGACTVTMTNASSVTAAFSQGITVSVPNGGETWLTNTTYTIRWSYLGNPGSSVQIALLKSGVLNKTIKNGAPIGTDGSGSYSWKVPNNQTAGSDYKIRVTSTTSGSFTDSSDADFTIN